MIFSLDGTFWVQLLNFGIFFAILNVVFMRPVGEALRKRREYIDSVQADFERYTKQIETLHAEAEQKRAAARQQSQEAYAKARAEAEREALAIAAEFETRANDVTQRARATVAAEVEQARAREHELSAALAQTLLDRAVGAGR